MDNQSIFDILNISMWSQKTPSYSYYSCEITPTHWVCTKGLTTSANVSYRFMILDENPRQQLEARLSNIPVVMQ